MIIDHQQLLIGIHAMASNPYASGMCDFSCFYANFKHSHLKLHGFIQNFHTHKKD